MRVSRPELAVWSFLMSSAHGAGLMLFPILIGAAPAMDHHAGPAQEVAAAGLSGASLGVGALALTVHLAAVVLVMGAVALLVYDKLGLAILRKGMGQPGLGLGGSACDGRGDHTVHAVTTLGGRSCST